MKNLKSLVLATVFSFQSVGFAAVGNFSASGEYLMSDYDTPEIAEQIALDFAEQNAAEQAGIYLKSHSKMSKTDLIEDEIKTVATSKVTVTEKNISRQTQRDGKILIRADIKATVDTSELDDFLAQEKMQRQAAIQRYKDLQAMNAQIKSDIDALQSKIAKLQDETKDDDFLVEQERINREFLSKQALSRLDYELALFINPKNAPAYFLRGSLTGYKTQNVIEELQDYNRAVILNPNDSRFYSAKGNAYKSLDEHNLAIKNYTKAIEILNANKTSSDPYLKYSMASNYMNRGLSYFTLKDDEHALDDYMKAIDYLPEDDPESLAGIYTDINKIGIDLILQRQAEAYKKNRDYSALAEIYTKMIKLDPDSQYNYGFRADAYRKLKQYDKAIADYDKAIKLSIKDNDEHDKKHYAELKKKTIDLKKHGDNQPKLKDKAALLERAKSYYNDEDYERAIKDYTELLKLEPENAEFLVERAECYRYLNDRERAVADLNRIVNNAPNSSTSYNYRSLVYNLMAESVEDYEKIIADCDKGLEFALNENNADNVDSFIFRKLEAISELVKLYMQQGKYNDATAKSDDGFIVANNSKFTVGGKEIDFGAKNKFGYIFNLQIFMRDIINSNVEAALAPAYLIRGKSYVEDDEHKEYYKAIADFTKVFEIYPIFLDALYYRGYTYGLAEKYSEALKDYTEVIQKLNQNKDYFYFSYNPSFLYNNRGFINAKCGYYEAALEDFQKAVELDSNNESAQENLRYILNLLKQRENPKND